MTNDYTYSYVPHQVVETEGVGLRAVVLRYLKNWPWFVLSVGLMLCAAYLYLLSKQPIYRIQASLLVQDEQKGSEQANTLQELGVFTSKKVVENEIEVLRSFTLMNRVVEKLQLDVRYFQDKTIGKQELYDESPIKLIVERANSALYRQPLSVDLLTRQSVRVNGQTYLLNRSVETPYGRLKIVSANPGSSVKSLSVYVQKRSSTVNGYVSILKAVPTVKASSVIQLSLEDAIPARGEAILNQLIEEYNRASLVDKNKVIAGTLKFIEDRLRVVSGELVSVEKGVESYKSSQGITNLSSQSETFLQTVQQNDALLNQVNIQLAALNDLEKYIKNQSNNRGTTPATVGLNDPVLLSLITKMTQLEEQRAELARTTSEQNPLLQTIDNQIQTTKNNMIENVASMKAQLVSSQKQYQDKNSQLEGKIRTIPEKERLLMTITRQQSIKNDLYTYLLKKREETAVAFASALSDSRTIDAAQSSDAPVRPARSTIFALFGLLGLLLPVAVMAGKDALNDRVTRRGDVEEVTQIPILGELVKQRHAESLVVTAKGQSVIGEQIRTLRANLPFLRNEDGKSQVLLFTSSVSGEGKSFVSLNLGASLALVDRPTVILDMDLRMPKLQKAFKMNSPIGVSDYLLEKVSIDEILQPVPGHPNYFLIASGAALANPAELLTSPRLKQMIDQLRERFEYIIIDTPPIGPVSDAQLIAPLVDATFFMVRHDVTPKNYLRMVDKLYQEQRFPKLNIILNAVDGTGSYYYGSGYEKGYTYGQMRKKNWLSRR